MGDSAGRIDLDLGINQAGFNQQLRSLGTTIAAAFSVKKLFDFGQSSIQLASDLTEVQNVVDVTFRGMSNQINDFSKTAITQFGLSELSAKQFTSTIGAMFKSSGIVGQQMTNMSEGIAGLTGDMSSFYNVAQKDMFRDIQSGISGEIEPLRRFGINMSVANLEAYALSQGIKTNYKDMDQAAQTLLRYNYLLSVTKDAQGDFARTSGSWANQVRLLGQQWDNLKITLGQGFINMLTPLLSVLNAIIAKLQIMASYFKAFTEVVWGSAGAMSTSTQNAAASTASVGDAATDTAGKVNKAAKSIKSSLGAFDQLNVIGQKSGSPDPGLDAANIDAGAGAGISTPSIDTSALDTFKEKVKSTTEAVKNFFAQTNQFIAEHKTTIVSVIAGIVAAFAAFAIITNWATIVEGFGLALDALLAPFVGISLGALAVAAAIGLFVAAVVDLWQTNQQFRDSVIQVWTEIKITLSKIIDDTWQIIKQTWDKYGASILKGLQDFWDNIKKIILDAWNVIIKPVIEDALKTLGDLWDKHLKGLVQTIADFVGKVIDDALQLYNGFIAPVVDWLVKNLGPAFVGVVKLIGDVISSLIGTIADVAKGIIEVLGGIIDFITGVFTGNWGKAWQGIKEIFGGIFDGIGGIFKGVINLIIDGINAFTRTLNWIPNELSKVPGFDWAKKFQIPDIPKLANGGLVSAPTLAMVGDNRGASQDPEVVSPLSKLQGMLGVGNEEVVELLKLILAAIKGAPPPSFKIGDTELARVISRVVNDEQRRTGQPLFNF